VKKKLISTFIIIALFIGSCLSALTEDEQSTLNNLRNNAARAREDLDFVYYRNPLPNIEQYRGEFRQGLLNAIAAARQLQQRQGTTNALGQALSQFINEQALYLADDEFRHGQWEPLRTPRHEPGPRLRRVNSSARRVLFPPNVNDNGVVLAGLSG
jgi:hypothetical protein